MVMLQSIPEAVELLAGRILRYDADKAIRIAARHDNLNGSEAAGLSSQHRILPTR